MTSGMPRADRTSGPVLESDSGPLFGAFGIHQTSRCAAAALPPARTTDATSRTRGATPCVVRGPASAGVPSRPRPPRGPYPAVRPAVPFPSPHRDGDRGLTHTVPCLQGSARTLPARRPHPSVHAGSSGRSFRPRALALRRRLSRSCTEAAAAVRVSSTKRSTSRRRSRSSGLRTGVFSRNASNLCLRRRRANCSPIAFSAESSLSACRLQRLNERFPVIRQQHHAVPGARQFDVECGLVGHRAAIGIENRDHVVACSPLRGVHRRRVRVVEMVQLRIVPC